MTSALVADGHLLASNLNATGPLSIADGLIESLDATHRPQHVIDADGLYVAPGFVDLQLNGAFGLDLQSDPAAMWEIGRQLPQHGVTAYLPTIVSAPLAAHRAGIAAMGLRPPDYLGAEPLGLHFEGPMLSPRRPGAHAVPNLVTPSTEIIEGWSRAEGVTLVTVAPELDGAAPVIEALIGRGVVVSAGHSDATAPQAEEGLGAGITMVTHLFNTMAPFGHRSPGIIGVALTDSRVVAGLIVDGVHVDPVAVAVAWHAKGPTGIALVTDASTPMGLGPGQYCLGDMIVDASERTVRTPNGTLAGSLLTMDQAVRNLIEYTGCELPDAITAAATTPADTINHPERGRLQPGAVADLVLLDEHLEVVITICGGRVAHVADGAQSRITPRPGI